MFQILKPGMKEGGGKPKMEKEGASGLRGRGFGHFCGSTTLYLPSTVTCRTVSLGNLVNALLGCRLRVDQEAQYRYRNMPIPPG
jgi:hypothetical protein